MTRRTAGWPAVIIVSALAAGVLTITDSASPARPLIALWFLCVCPGMAFVRLLRLGEGLTEMTLAIALSLAMDVIVAGVLLYAGVWSPRWGLIVLIALSLVGAILQVTTSRPLVHVVRIAEPGDLP